MALSINNNIAAVNSYRNLSITQNDLSKSLEKLSSGFRINRAADDAAGLAISEGLRSQVGGLKVAVRNAQDGISVVQTAEGALTETHAILQRMRDLSVQASNEGGLSEDAKKNIQSEISELKFELTRIADTTQFNGTKLLDGSYNGKFQIGANEGEVIAVAVNTAMSASGLGVAGVDVTTDATDAISATVALATTGGGGTVTTATTGSLTTTAGFEALNGTITIGNKSIDLASIQYGKDEDASGAVDVADYTATLKNAISNALGIAGTDVVITAGNELQVTGPAAKSAVADDVAAATPKFTAASGASQAITIIGEAINAVSTVRADLGAKQNRLDHTINSLNVAVENLSASESRIRDTDMASEMVNFTRSQILSQAGTAMLAQANQIPQGILQLLR
ncbi:flagellin [Georgenia yuyongxinii]|uniref:Flagellin n=1 Tax=Georgenia yuyongxinii TaxID=2589797 RepID=A0A552WSC3_9MICO|nr:flagellin [Georgenia yuyongxinii]TRW45617.1 flagellin [Georgenia yuyongxinii]